MGGKIAWYCVQGEIRGLSWMKEGGRKEGRGREREIGLGDEVIIYQTTPEAAFL